MSDRNNLASGSSSSHRHTHRQYSPERSISSPSGSTSRSATLASQREQTIQIMLPSSSTSTSIATPSSSSRQRLQQERRKHLVRRAQRFYEKFGIKHLLLLISLNVYALIGAAIFEALERPRELRQLQRAAIQNSERRSHFIELLLPKLVNNSRFLFFANYEKSADVTALFEEEFRRYESHIGYSAYGDKKLQWSFVNSLIYAVSLFTTIGYGTFFHVRTSFGRVATVIYAAFGIPLLIWFISDFGSLLAKLLRLICTGIISCCQRCFRCLRNRSSHRSSNRQSESTEQIALNSSTYSKQNTSDDAITDTSLSVDYRNGIAFLFAVLLLIFWILFIPAIICLWEGKWSYNVAFYFFFVTLSTIGIGDVWPEHPRYLLLVLVFAIVGLMIIIMCIILLQDSSAGTEYGGLWARSAAQAGAAGGRSSISDFTSGSHPSKKICASVQTLLSVPVPKTLNIKTDARGRTKLMAKGYRNAGKSRDDVHELFKSYDDVEFFYGKDYQSDDVALKSFGIPAEYSPESSMRSKSISVASSYGINI